MKKAVSFLSALVIMAMSSSVFAATDIGSGKIRAEGVSDAIQQPAAGYKSAQLDANRNLLEQVQGVMVESGVEVDSRIQSDGSIKITLESTIRRASVVDKYRDKYGYYHVIVELPVYGANSLAAVAMPVRQQVAISDNVTNSTVENAVVSPYTGVIIDCTSLGLQTAMAPAIIAADNRIIYGLENFTNEFAVMNGYVSYVRNTTDGGQRAGTNPLIVKAISVNNFCNPVIACEDANKILAENAASWFLSQGNVVFVR